MYFREDPAGEDCRGLSSDHVEKVMWREQFVKQLELEKTFWIGPDDIKDVINFLNQIKSDNSTFSRDIDNAVMFLKQAISKV